MSQQNHQIYEFGPFHLDATRRVLLKEGEPQKLFPEEKLFAYSWLQDGKQFAFAHGSEIRDVVLLQIK
jgi:hypothetical protein